MRNEVRATIESFLVSINKGLLNSYQPEVRLLGNTHIADFHVPILFELIDFKWRGGNFENKDLLEELNKIHLANTKYVFIKLSKSKLYELDATLSRFCP